MLCRNPQLLVYDVGFLLSFGAIVGIVTMNNQEEMGRNVKKQEEIGKEEGEKEKKREGGLLRSVACMIQTARRSCCLAMTSFGVVKRCFLFVVK